MKLDRAIEVLEDWINRETIVNADDFMKAQRLSFEALKFFKDLEDRGALPSSARLPGETED